MRGRVATKYVGATAEKKMFCNVIFRRLWMKRLKINKRLKDFFDYKYSDLQEKLYNNDTLFQRILLQNCKGKIKARDLNLKEISFRIGEWKIPSFPY